MPKMLKQCRHVGCTRLVPGGYCPEHKSDEKQAIDRYHKRGGRHDERNRIWRSARWRNYTRPIVLERDGHACVYCHREANTVHHVVDILMLIDLGRDPYDPDECVTACHECHGQVDKAREQGQDIMPSPKTYPSNERGGYL